MILVAVALFLFFCSSFRRRPESSSLLFFGVQSVRLALRASRLLLALPKSNQKARHRTRRSDSHRANRTALRFSSSRGRSDSTVPVLLRDRGDPSPRPFGLIPRSLRCSAPRTAPVVHESVHPCTASLRLFAPLPIWRNSHKCERLLLRQDAAKTGPPVARRAGGGKARRGARRKRARALRAHGCALSDPRSPLANLEGRMPGRRATWGVFLSVTFLCTSKER